MSVSSKQRFADFRKQFRAGVAPPDANGTESDPAQSSNPRRGAYLRFYFQWLRPFKWQIGFVFVLALAATILGLVPPYAMKLIVDRILDDPTAGAGRAGKLSMLHLAGGGVLLVLVVQQCLDALRNYRMSLLNLRVLRRLQQRLHEHLLRLPIHELQQMKSGGIVTRVSNDVDDVSGLVQMALITPTVAAFRVVATMAILIWMQWRMALVAVAILVPIVVINLLWIRKLKPLHRSIRRDRGEVNARVVETFGGLPVVRVFRRERTETRDFVTGQNTIVRKRMLSRVYRMVVTTAWGLMIPLSGLIIIWYGGTRYLVEQVTLGDIFAFQAYVFMLMMPISQIVRSWSETQHSLAALERTFDVMQRPVEMPDKPDAAEAPTTLSELRFEKVSFGYDPAVPVLAGISVSVRAGQAVALVGRSGSGKTTFTNLVARFYDPDQGRITLNGVDLRDLKLAGYRSLLGMVQQDTFLFDGTVRDNIAYGRRGASLDDVVAAARRANAHQFVQALADGYETVIGERGIRLSGGQKQRVSIARALLADPRILILDEATSSLDSESEALIQASLRELLANRTTFVIAHRLSTVTRADLILVMDEGRIVERGRHAELIEAGGLYAEMVARQRDLHAGVVGSSDDELEWA